MKGLNTFHASGKLPSLKIWSSASGELEWCKALLAEKQHQRTWCRTPGGFLRAGGDGSFHWAQSVSTQLYTSHSASMQKALLVITKCNCSLKRKQRCSPLCEVFKCVKVGSFFAISEWPRWSPAWRDPSSCEPSREEGWATTGLNSSKGGVTGNVPLWGSCQDLEDFPMKGPVDVPQPCLTWVQGTSQFLRKAGKGSCKADLSSLYLTLEHKAVKHSHPDDLEVSDCFLSFRNKSKF